MTKGKKKQKDMVTTTKKKERQIEKNDRI